VLNKDTLGVDNRFTYRGIRTNLDRKHFDLAVKEEVNILPGQRQSLQSDNFIYDPF